MRVTIELTRREMLTVLQSAALAKYPGCMPRVDKMQLQLSANDGAVAFYYKEVPPAVREDEYWEQRGCSFLFSLHEATDNQNVE